MTEPPRTTPEVELEFPPGPEHVRTARHTVGALADLHGFAPDLVDDVKLAVSEACTNAIAANAEAAGEDRAPEAVLLRAWADERGIEVEVLDRGAGDVREVSGDPEEISTEELPFTRALSLPLIRGLVDELRIVQRDGGGSTLSMRLASQAQAEA